MDCLRYDVRVLHARAVGKGGPPITAKYPATWRPVCLRRTSSARFEPARQSSTAFRMPRAFCVCTGAHVPLPCCIGRLDLRTSKVVCTFGRGAVVNTRRFERLLIAARLTRTIVFGEVCAAYHAGAVSRDVRLHNVWHFFLSLTPSLRTEALHFIFTNLLVCGVSHLRCFCSPSASFEMGSSMHDVHLAPLRVVNGEIPSLHNFKSGHA